MSECEVSNADNARQDNHDEDTGGPDKAEERIKVL